jgi:O-Antigen ligase
MQSEATAVSGLRTRRLSIVSRASFRRLDAGAIGLWVLAGGLVLYLGIDGGGYDLVVHSRVGILVWWVVLLGALFGLLPTRRASRSGLAALGLFAAFLAWTALGLTWTISSERTLADISLVAGYLGVLTLAISAYGDRDRALRHTIAAVATAIVVIAALALLARLRPDLFPAAQQTVSYLPGTQRRLGWPLNYWNALAALMAFGLPLLWGLATSARTLPRQAAAAGAIPVVLVVSYLTFSRAGVISAVIALIAFLALAPDRFAKLAGAAAGAAGGAILIAGAAHRSAIEQGLADAAARHQGNSLLLATLVVCAGVALAQAGIGLAVRHGARPRALVISRQRARVLLAAGVAALVVLVAVAGATGAISHTWNDFKNNSSAALKDNSISRYGTVSGNGRYDYWKVAAKSLGGRVPEGSGPGTYQLVWLPHAPRNFSYIQNAHSLYFETLAEVGVIGLLLLLSFLGLVLVCAVRLVIQTRDQHRTRAAAAAAAIVAFVVSAASDWIWQVPVLPVAFLLLAGALLAPRGGSSGAARRVPRLASRLVVRLAMLAVAVGCVVAIGIPLLKTDALRASEAAASQGRLSTALREARDAAGWEPGAASPQVQIALVQESLGNLHAALAAAQRAARNEPDNWSTWLILSRLQAEAGNVQSAVADYRRARSLNPSSTLFSSL